MDKKLQCQAMTRSGSRCKNRAREGSAYCHVHQPEVPPSEVASTPDTVSAAKSAPNAHGVVSASSSKPNPVPTQVAMLIYELDALVAELRRRVPNPRKPLLTPAQLLELLNRHIGAYAPAAQGELLMDLERNLRDATFRDLVDPETLKGLWYILFYSLQSQTAEYQETVVERLRHAPGAALLLELRSNLAGTTPQDLLDPETWKGFWYVLSYSAQYQIAETKRRVLGRNREP